MYGVSKRFFKHQRRSHPRELPKQASVSILLIHLTGSTEPILEIVKYLDAVLHWRLYLADRGLHQCVYVVVDVFDRC